MHGSYQKSPWRHEKPVEGGLKKHMQSDIYFFTRLRPPTVPQKLPLVLRNWGCLEMLSMRQTLQGKSVLLNKSQMVDCAKPSDSEYACCKNLVIRWRSSSGIRFTRRKRRSRPNWCVLKTKAAMLVQVWMLPPMQHAFRVCFRQTFDSAIPWRVACSHIVFLGITSNF